MVRVAYREHACWVGRWVHTPVPGGRLRVSPKNDSRIGPWWQVVSGGCEREYRSAKGCAWLLSLGCVRRRLLLPFACCRGPYQHAKGST
jgi:hypothetical protein